MNVLGNVIQAKHEQAIDWMTSKFSLLHYKYVIHLVTYILSSPIEHKVRIVNVVWLPRTEGPMIQYHCT